MSMHKHYKRVDLLVIGWSKALGGIGEWDPVRRLPFKTFETLFWLPKTWTHLWTSKTLVPAPHRSADPPAPQVPTPSTKPHFLSPHFRVLVQDATPLKHQPYFPSVRFPIAVPAGWPLTLSFFFPFPPKTHLNRGCCRSFLLGNERVGAALEAICHQGGLIGAQSWATPASQVGISWSSTWLDGMSTLIRRTWYPWHLKKKTKKTQTYTRVWGTSRRHSVPSGSNRKEAGRGWRPGRGWDASSMLSLIIWSMRLVWLKKTVLRPRPHRRPAGFFFFQSANHSGKAFFSFGKWRGCQKQ